MATRSQLLGFHAFSTPRDLFVWTGPAGATTIVKRLSTFNSGGAAIVARWRIFRAGLTLELRADNHAVGEAKDLEVWWAIQPGDRLGVRILETSGFYYYVSGATLEGVSPYPPQAGSVTQVLPA